MKNENTIENTSSLPGASYNLLTARFMDSGGIVLTNKKINEALSNDDVARSAGVGLATFKKAVVVRSILETLQDGRTVANALAESKYGVVKL